ncbi:RICIN domain-containing protein [Streptomyces atroolivaceus]|uniref:RICIN domain-containing protein n=1 Tax=Streptomyces atroolivaceus TaxID=66869 RepID=UPI0033D3BE94
MTATGSTGASTRKCTPSAATRRPSTAPTLVLWSCHGGPNQKWTYDASTKALVNPQSGGCLDIPESSDRDGAQLQIFDCNSTGAQQWLLPS